MVEDILKKIARQIMALDEEGLLALLPVYKKRMDAFIPNGEWEEAVIIYFIINGYRIKNAMFNERVKEYMEGQKKKDSAEWLSTKPELHLIK